MISKLKQGPAVAEVDKIKAIWETPPQIYEDFSIL